MVSQLLNSRGLDLPPGTLLSGRFRLQRELGRGAGSVVYLAHDAAQDTLVALRAMILGTQEQARLRREVLAAWDVTHDHALRIHGCFEEGERSFVVMDHVPGPDLGSRVAGQGSLSVDEAAALGRGAALALRAAHRRGILHRHVHPGNILIGPETRGYLADFGCAGSGAPPGARRDYQAPEVTGGQAADVRSDIYGLGLSLYFGLTGRLPARQDPARPPLPAADGYRPARWVPTIPAWLDEAVAAATAALPADRYASAGRLAEVLTPGPDTGDFSPLPAPITVRA